MKSLMKKVNESENVPLCLVWGYLSDTLTSLQVSFHINPHKFYQDGVTASWLFPTSGWDLHPPPLPTVGVLWGVTLSFLSIVNYYNFALIPVHITSSDNPGGTYVEIFFLGYLLNKVILEKLFQNVWKMSHKFNSAVAHFQLHEHIWSHDVVHLPPLMLSSPYVLACIGYRWKG